MAKKIFVSGCFDMLHSGHVAFLKEAASYGDVYVGLGADTTFYALKGRVPINTQYERKFMLEALSSVKQCKINRGSGILDFKEDLLELKPDIFLVNEDGNSPAKEQLCKQYGIEYKILKRIPYKGLPVRSTIALRKECVIPYRIDLAGGWLDQPFVSKFSAGSVITISIEPTFEFNERSGMATSTRKKAIELWNLTIPTGNLEHFARILFSFENPPGTKAVSGSQDSLGIVFPGLNRFDYSNNYWPKNIISVHDEEILSWLESTIYLIPLEPRNLEYDVLQNTAINKINAEKLAFATENCWEAILNKNVGEFGRFFRESFEAQVAMFPNMVDKFILDTIESYRSKSLGWKLSGAGGGGYLILISNEPIEGAMRIKVRRKEE